MLRKSSVPATPPSNDFLFLLNTITNSRKMAWRECAQVTNCLVADVARGLGRNGDGSFTVACFARVGPPGPFRDDLTDRHRFDRRGHALWAGLRSDAGHARTASPSAVFDQ